MRNPVARQSIWLTPHHRAAYLSLCALFYIRIEQSCRVQVLEDELRLKQEAAEQAQKKAELAEAGAVLARGRRETIVPLVAAWTVGAITQPEREATPPAAAVSSPPRRPRAISQAAAAQPRRPQRPDSAQAFAFTRRKDVGAHRVGRLWEAWCPAAARQTATVQAPPPPPRPASSHAHTHTTHTRVHTAAPRAAATLPAGWRV
jgi:hypothetical protein